MAFEGVQDGKYEFAAERIPQVPVGSQISLISKLPVGAQITPLVKPPIASQIQIARPSMQTPLVEAAPMTDSVVEESALYPSYEESGSQQQSAPSSMPPITMRQPQTALPAPEGEYESGEDEYDENEGDETNKDVVDAEFAVQKRESTQTVPSAPGFSIDEIARKLGVSTKTFMVGSIAAAVVFGYMLFGGRRRD